MLSATGLSFRFYFVTFKYVPKFIFIMFVFQCLLVFLSLLCCRVFEGRVENFSSLVLDILTCKGMIIYLLFIRLAVNLLLFCLGYRRPPYLTVLFLLLVLGTDNFVFIKYFSLVFLVRDHVFFFKNGFPIFSQLFWFICLCW